MLHLLFNASITYWLYRCCCQIDIHIHGTTHGCVWINKRWPVCYIVLYSTVYMDFNGFSSDLFVAIISCYFFGISPSCWMHLCNSSLVFFSASKYIYVTYCSAIYSLFLFMCLPKNVIYTCLFVFFGVFVSG